MGFVGSTIAYTLVVCGLVKELVLIDRDKDKAEGDAMDMNHGLPFIAPMDIRSGDYADASGSDIVIITAGAAQRPGETRRDLLKHNTSIMEEIVTKLLPYCDDQTILLIVSNPVDVLTYVAYRCSGFAPNRVFGSGTELDTARLKFLIGEHLNIDARNVHTYIIGEHGDSEVPVFSLTSVAGMPITFFCEQYGRCDTVDVCYDDLYNRTKKAAYEIIQRKGATYYAVALTVKRIVACVMGNEHSVLTVSSVLNGQYGITDVALSVPSIVSREGVVHALEVILTPEEEDKLRKSAMELRQLAREVGY